MEIIKVDKMVEVMGYCKGYNILLRKLYVIYNILLYVKQQIQDLLLLGF
jgi:hypothetical protein